MQAITNNQQERNRNIYGFGKGFRAPNGADPEVVGAFLDELREQHGGELTPEIVLNAAKPEESPIHGWFEWDDAEAAMQWRLDQARYLIRMIVVIHDEAPPFRAFVSIDTEEDPNKRRYMGIHDAINDDRARAVLLRRAQGEIVSWRQRYSDLQEFARIFKVIDKLPLLSA